MRPRTGSCGEGRFLVKKSEPCRGMVIQALNIDDDDEDLKRV